MNALPKVLADAIGYYRRKFHWLDGAEIESACCLGYTQALQRWDPSKPAGLNWFASIRMRGEVTDTVRRHYRERRLVGDSPIDACSFDDDEEGTVSVVSSPPKQESAVEAQERLSALARDLESMPSRTAAVVRLALCGFSMCEIGEKLGLHKSRVNRILHDAIRSGGREES